MITKSEVLVVIPAFNEEATVAQVISGVQAEGFAVVVVNDGSTDATAALSRSAGADVLSLPLNAGVGGALHTGFRFAVAHGYRAIIQCDADGQHPSKHLTDLLDAANHYDADIVIGSRFKSDTKSMEISSTRKLAMSCLAIIASYATKHKITDATSGFRIITQPLLREFAESFPTYYLGDTFEAVVVAGRAGYNVIEIGAPIAPRMSGSSTSTSARSVGLIAKSLFVVVFGLHFRIAEKNYTPA